MPNNSINPSILRVILRLHNSGRSKRHIAKILGISRNTASKYIDLFKVCGVSYPEIANKDDLFIQQLFVIDDYVLSQKAKELEKLFPDFDLKLEQPDMTKGKLWEEYFRLYPDGYSRTQFMYYYNRWRMVTPID